MNGTAARQLAWIWVMTLCALTLLCGARRPAAAAANNSKSAAKPSAPTAASDSFETFKIVTERNIFDPKRTRAQVARSAAPPTPQKTERIDLIGALILQEGAFAFFEGSRSEYTATLREGDKFGDFRVAEIRTDRVTLERKGRQVRLPVGAGLTRQGEGEWQLAAAPAPRTESSSNNDSHSSDSNRHGSDSRSDGNSGNDHGKDLKKDFKEFVKESNGDHGSKGGNESPEDLLKKLMEKRMKEMGR